MMCTWLPPPAASRVASLITPVLMWPSGWTPDGRSVLFRTTRSSYSRFEKLYTVPATGGFPTPLPLPMGVEGSYSPDGTHLAYVPRWNRRLGAVDSYVAIKYYRGGLTAPIWIANLADSSITRVPREASNDFNPMWVGDRIYFLSDRSGPVTLFSYDTKTQQVKQLFKNDGFDLKSASAGPGGIVYEQLGSIHIYDPHSGKSREVAIRVAGDMPQVRPQFEKIDQPPDSEPRTFLPPARARCLRRTAKFSPCRRKKATCATSRIPRAWRSAIPRGRPTANRSLTFPTNPASTRFTSATRTAWDRQEDRSGQAAVLLLRAHVVAGQQENCL